jgi:hypothetical protein
VGAEATPWPIVGRDGELAAVQGAIVDPSCGGVILAGPQGAGRTSLARELEFRALAAGRATLWATGTRAASALPFGALAHLLPDVPAGWDLDPTELLGRVGAVVGEPGPAGPPIVVVDDAHLLDGLSAVFLHRAVLRRLVAVALTVRGDAPAPDPVVALWKDGLVDRITVGPLGREDTAELLERALGAPLDAVSFERLWGLTRGTPLFLREIVRAALAAGALARRRGAWQWDGGLGEGDRLAGLVEARPATEDPRCRPVLELVACGEPLAEPLGARDGLELLERADMYRFARLWLAELAAALAGGGDGGAARDAYDQSSAQDPRTNRVFDPWIALDGAWVCAAEGRFGEAVDRALAAAEEARGLGQRAFEVVAAYDVARLGRPELVVDRLGALVPLVDGAFAPACRRAAVALDERDPAGLTDCSRLFEELGHDLLAAEAATAAHALLLRAGPSPAAAAHAAVRAARLRDRCPGVTTPLLDLVPASDRAA